MNGYIPPSYAHFSIVEDTPTGFYGDAPQHAFRYHQHTIEARHSKGTINGDFINVGHCQLAILSPTVLKESSVAVNEYFTNHSADMLHLFTTCQTHLNLSQLAQTHHIVIIQKIYIKPQYRGIGMLSNYLKSLESFLEGQYQRAMVFTQTNLTFSELRSEEVNDNMLLTYNLKLATLLRKSGFKHIPDTQDVLYKTVSSYG